MFFSAWPRGSCGVDYDADNRLAQLVDTETDSVAEMAFKKLGYTEIGKVPHFSRALSNGKKGETFFYKEFLPSST